MSKQKQIIVLGMHRSGTSALMGVLDSLGIFVGGEEELTEANWENPRGFFERRDLRDICDTLLHAADADWWKVSAFDTASIPKKTLTAQRKAIEALVGDLERHGDWAIKEPRLCLLYPLFKPALHNPFIVFIYRHPYEVAQSLYRRNGFPLQAGLALWEHYTHAALACLKDTPHLMVSYHALTANASQCAAMLVETLNLPAPSRNNAVDPSLHREQVDEKTAKAIMTDAQQELWKMVESERCGATKKPSSAGEVLATFEEYFQRLTNKEAELEAQRAELRAMTRERDKHKKDAQKLAVEVEELSELATQRAQQLDAVYQSTSWKITQPLRKATAALKPKPSSS